MAINDTEFEQIRDFTYQLCGMYFSNAKKYFLSSRISKRMEVTGAKTVQEYCTMLRNGRTSGELRNYLDDITTNETYFFRSLPQLNVVDQTFLAEIVAIKGKIGFRKIRVWSAGSSSGEEAYTLAMMLNEKRSGLLKDWVIEIVGTDISEAVLTQAREGIYSAYSVRNVPESYKRKYFTKLDENRWQLSQDIRKMVTFSNVNLYEDQKMIFMKSFDMIFCANVLIYFDVASKTKVVQHFYNNLQPYGYFFVGQSESLHGISDKFKTVYFPGGFAYHK